MKNIQKCSLQGTKFIHLLSCKLALTVAAVGLFVAIPSSVQAKGVTQLAFLQTLAQVTGDQLGASASVQDVIQWAQAKGMNPSGGWNPTATLTRDQLAQLLVQLLNLNPKKGGGDYLRILQREGIDLGEDGEVTATTIARTLDGGLTTHLPNAGSPVKHGNNGLGNGEDPPPPGFLNPRNPHFGGGQNDGPGTSPGNPNSHNKP